MLGRSEIHNAAILHPQMTKYTNPCWRRGHQFAMTKSGRKQCIECGFYLKPKPSYQSKQEKQH